MSGIHRLLLLTQLGGRHLRLHLQHHLLHTLYLTTHKINLRYERNFLKAVLRQKHNLKYTKDHYTQIVCFHTVKLHFSSSHVNACLNGVSWTC